MEMVNGPEVRPQKEQLMSLVQLEKSRLRSELTPVQHLPHEGKRGRL